MHFCYKEFVIFYFQFIKTYQTCHTKLIKPFELLPDWGIVSCSPTEQLLGCEFWCQVLNESFLNWIQEIVYFSLEIFMEL